MMSFQWGKLFLLRSSVGAIGVHIKASQTRAQIVCARNARQPHFKCILNKSECLPVKTMCICEESDFAAAANNRAGTKSERKSKNESAHHKDSTNFPHRQRARF